MSRTQNACALSWHGERGILVAGWKDGALLVYNQDDQDKKTREIQPETGAPITCIKWCPDGQRFIACDANSTVSIWRLARGDKCEKIQEYKAQEPIEFIDFKATNIALKNESEQHGESAADDGASQPGTPAADEYASTNDWIFFLAGNEGMVYVADDVGHMRVAFNMKSPIAAFLHYEEKNTFVTLTYKSVLALYEVDDDLKIKQSMRSKINVSTGGNCPDLKALWVGRGVMATCANETLIRVWNLDTDDSYQLTTNEIRDPIVNIAFNPRKRVISGVTTTGIIYSWQFVGSESDPQGDEDWELYSTFTAERPTVSFLQWGPGESLLSYCTDEGAMILHETTLKRKMRGQMVAIQTSTNQLNIERVLDSSSQQSATSRGALPVKAGISIRDLDLSNTHVALSNGKQVEIYVLKEGIQSFTAKDPINVSASAIGVHRENLFVCTMNRLEVYNFNGTKKQTITFSQTEGDPACIDICEDYIAVGTTNSHLKLFQMTGRETRPIGVAKKLFEDSKRRITSVCVNCTGQKVSILSKDVHKSGIQQPSTFLTVFDINLNKVDEHNFAQYGRYPVSHFWDEIEPKMISVEAKRFSSMNKKDTGGLVALNVDGGVAVEIFSLFSTPDDGVLKQDSFPLDRKLACLVGTKVPSLYFVAKEEDTAQSMIQRKSMRDFEGINVQDNETRDALLHFSYFLTIGSMEEAYKAVKTIKDTNVWHNMAQMCVKTKKMDVAEICLSNMQNARASKALREAKREPEIEAQIAMLAIQLGMIEEAEKLYKTCGRFDLLSNLYQSMGDWDQALSTCQKHDRIHLKTMHYQYARYLEQIGEFQDAIRHYELSKNHKYEIPRMLFDAEKIQLLHQYIQQHNDSDLQKWWAQYCEGNGDYESAFNYYVKAKDYFSLVRMNCFMKQFDQAAEIVKASGDRSSAFHLARQLESAGQFDEAIKYYKVARRFRHAIGVAMQRDMPQEAWNIAIEAPANVKVEAAHYFEEKNMKDKAVLLYQKGGYVSKAIDLCFKSELFDVLLQIADSLDENADPSILIRCGDFFAKHHKYEKAVMMYINAQEVERALEICQRHNVIISEDMANKMTPPKTENPEQQNNRDRRLLQIAQATEAQGSYQIATKLYVQAGDKAKAMRVLIKSGDTQKIIYFAVLSRKKDLYILAANYLQTLEWHNNSELTSSISSFYKKAKSWDKLALFYEACSQVEIDEYRDYEKALDALKDSLKYLNKVPRVVRSKVEELKSKIASIERFLAVQKADRSDSESMEQICRELLRDAEYTEAVRIGDIYALLVENYHSAGEKQKAYQIILEMKDQKIELGYYLGHSLLKDISQSLGVPLSELEDAPRGSPGVDAPADPMYDPTQMLDEDTSFQEEFLDEDL